MLGLFIVPFNDAVAKALSTDLNIMEIILIFYACQQLIHMATDLELTG